MALGPRPGPVRRRALDPRRRRRNRRPPSRPGTATACTAASAGSPTCSPRSAPAGPGRTGRASWRTPSATRVRAAIPGRPTRPSSTAWSARIGVLTALEAPGAEDAVARLRELATGDGWAQTRPRRSALPPGARINDADPGHRRRPRRCGLGAPARRRRSSGPRRAGGRRAAAEAEAVPTGLNWPFVPRRFVAEPTGDADAELVPRPGRDRRRPRRWPEPSSERPDLVDAARSGAEHSSRSADTRRRRVRGAARTIPRHRDLDDVTYTWCHGPAGTSLLFRPSSMPASTTVAGRTPSDWHRRCLHACGPRASRSACTPGSGTTTDAAAARPASVTSSSTPGSAHGERGRPRVRGARSPTRWSIARSSTAPHAYWRFVEHRNAEPLLPPGVGWMQGAAGIAAYLFRVSRVVEHRRGGRAVARMDTWWARRLRISAGDASPESCPRPASACGHGHAAHDREAPDVHSGRVGGEPDLGVRLGARVAAHDADAVHDHVRRPVHEMSAPPMNALTVKVTSGAEKVAWRRSRSAPPIRQNTLKCSGTTRCRGARPRS